MQQVFLDGGYIMWPLALITLALGWLTLRAAVQLGRRRDIERTTGSLRTILFWGLMSPLIGLLGTALGWISMSRALAAVGSVSSDIVWNGVRITLFPLTFGVLICATAALCWFVLRQWSARVTQRS